MLDMKQAVAWALVVMAAAALPPSAAEAQDAHELDAGRISVPMGSVEQDAQGRSEVVVDNNHRSVSLTMEYGQGDIVVRIWQVEGARALVATLPCKLEGAAYVARWSGLNDSGSMVRNGLYKFDVAAKGQRLSSDEYPIRVNFLWNVSDLAVSPNPFWPGSAGIESACDISFVANRETTVSIALCEKATGNVVWAVPNKNVKPGNVHISWDGRDTLGSLYEKHGAELEVKVEDLLFTTQPGPTPVRLSIQGMPSIENLEAVPARFSPNGDGINDETRISFTVHVFTPKEAPILYCEVCRSDGQRVHEWQNSLIQTSATGPNAAPGVIGAEQYSYELIWRGATVDGKLDPKTASEMKERVIFIPADQTLTKVDSFFQVPNAGAYTIRILAADTEHVEAIPKTVKVQVETAIGLEVEILGSLPKEFYPFLTADDTPPDTFNPAQPNRHAVVFEVNKDANVVVEVYSIAQGLVHHENVGTVHAGKPMLFQWDGTSAEQGPGGVITYKVVEDGYYYIDVIATDLDAPVTVRGRTKNIRRREEDRSYDMFPPFVKQIKMPRVEKREITIPPVVREVRLLEPTGEWLAVDPIIALPKPPLIKVPFTPQAAPQVFRCFVNRIAKEESVESRLRSLPIEDEQGVGKEDKQGLYVRTAGKPLETSWDGRDDHGAPADKGLYDIVIRYEIPEEESDKVPLPPGFLFVADDLPMTEGQKRYQERLLEEFDLKPQPSASQPAGREETFRIALLNLGDVSWTRDTVGSLHKISPDGDGEEDRLELEALTAEPCLVRLSILDEKEDTVWQDTRPLAGRNGKTSFLFEAKANTGKANGTLLPDGKYTTRLEVQSLCAVSETALDVGAPDVWNAATVEDESQGKLSFCLSRTLSSDLMIDRKPVMTNLAVEPRVISPDGDGIDDQQDFSFEMADRASVWIEVSKDGRTIHTSEREVKPQGPAKVSWDGCVGREGLVRPVDEGSYTILVRAQDLDPAKNETESPVQKATVTSYWKDFAGPVGRAAERASGLAEKAAQLRRRREARQKRRQSG